MESYEQARDRQRDAAAERVSARTEARLGNEAVLVEPGGLARVDTEERIAKRLDRLSRYVTGDAPPPTVLTAPPAAIMREAVERVEGGQERETAAEPAKLLEKIILTADFVGVRYLDAGVVAARAIGRVNIVDAGRNPAGFGTGSLVSASLLLTNHHVLPDADTARNSFIEFNYQDGADGKVLDTETFGFDPDRFFLADDERDFALVAVRATPEQLAPYGFNPLIEAEGKAIIGEFVTIVQHPRGEKKQIALRENKIVDLPDRFMHYAADTEPGSSGSPVFNDQWEVVALHHASVAAPDHAEFGGFLNEGIRVSRIMQFVKDQPLSPAMRTLADALFAAPEAAPAAPPAAPPPPPPHAPIVVPASPPAAGGEVTITVPLEITVRVGDAAGAAPPPAQGVETEAVSIDPDYSNRKGYDAAFLAQPLPLPVPGPALDGQASDELRYHHFSVVMHRERALALFTAVNIDGKLARQPKRERDRWIIDPRLPAEFQTGEPVYKSNPLDRGHLVRRLDPAWGTDAEAVKAANDDTFHFTNAAPQHHQFNAGSTLWAGLEDHILTSADTADLLVSVITGPVLADDDDPYRGVRLPRQFWKVVGMVTTEGRLSVTGYLLSQSALLDDLPTEEAFSFGAFRTFQVPVRRIAELTGLLLEPHAAADPLERLESMPLPRELIRASDLIL
jgi:endonuclease G